MEWLIDWWQSRRQVKQRVNDLIDQAAKDGKVLCLPIQIRKGRDFYDTLALILSQVHCSACNAPCCRRNPGDNDTSMLLPEYERLAEKYGRKNFLIKDGKAYLPMPCPFLKNGTCGIYEDRPLICVLYPFQTGATDNTGSAMIALASVCPEARRITRNIYMSSWWIRNQFRLIQ